MKQTGHLIPPLCMETFWYSYSYISKVSSHKRSSELQYQSKVSITKHMEHRSSETIAAAAAAAASLQSCPSLRPHRQQPTRLPRPWDSPGKNTGVGCHFLLHCMKVKSQSEVAQSCLTPSNPMDCSLPGSSIHGIFQARVLEWSVIAFS